MAEGLFGKHAADADGDGIVSPEEYEQWFNDIIPLWQKSHLRNMTHKPEGYVEGNIYVTWVKAIGKALAAFFLYYGALDQLSDVNFLSFTPCQQAEADDDDPHGLAHRRNTSHEGSPSHLGACSYWLLFSNDNVPASGAHFMQVKNGVVRPLALSSGFEVYYEDPAGASEFNQVDEGMKTIVGNQNEEIGDRFTWRSRWSLKILRGPIHLFTWPMSKLGWLYSTMYKGTYGMGDIKPALCKGMGAEEMEKECKKKTTMNRIQNHMEKGASRFAVMFCLGGWALFGAVHDVMLLHDNKLFRQVSEMKTLLVHGVSVMFQGLAVAFLFFWAMGAMAVFTADPEVAGDEDCRCYYQMPTLQSYIALATPFALLFAFAANVQMWGMAALYGDYVTSLTFTVPQYLARNTMLWTWLTFVSPVTTGTRSAYHPSTEYEMVKKDDEIVKPFEENKGGLTPRNPKGALMARETFSRRDWRKLFWMQRSLWILRLIVASFVSVAASPFVVRFRLVMEAVAVKEFVWHNAGRRIAMKAVLLLPPIVMLFFGIEMILSLKDFCFPHGAKTFADNVTSYLPSSWTETTKQVQTMARRKTAHLEALPEGAARLFKNRPTSPLAVLFFIVVSSFLGLIILATFQGLCPDVRYVLAHGPEPPDWLGSANIAQVELWGACGFMLVCITIQRLLQLIYLVYDEFQLLNQLQEDSNVPTNNQVADARDLEKDPLLQTSPRNNRVLALNCCGS